MEEHLGLGMWNLINNQLIKDIEKIKKGTCNATDSTQYYPIQAGSR